MFVQELSGIAGTRFCSRDTNGRVAADGVCKNNVIVGGGLQGGRTGGRLVCSVVSMSPGSFTSAPSNRKLWQL